jgi:hypothetical protein
MQGLQGGQKNNLAGGDSVVDLESMLTDSRYTPALEMLGEVELRYWLY